ncbi:MAG: uroporphyrinogen-III synthase [Planctomycetes bacterium]|nr:uroporphyrinogen-III synthase [Planctomycetota bacterium]
MKVPLYGRRVVITRPRVRASEWVRAFATVGADVIPFPTFELVLPEPEQRREIVALLRRYADRSATMGEPTWVAVTSPTSAENLWNIVESDRAELDEHLLERFRIAAVGESTTKILTDRGLTVSLVADEANARALADALIERGVGAGSAVFHVSSSRGRPQFVERLIEIGADAQPIHVSQNRPIDGRDTTLLERELDQHGLDLLTFASPSAAERLLAIAPPPFVVQLRRIASLAAGRTTAEALDELGFETIVTARSPRVEDVVKKAIEFFGGAD